MPQVSVPSSPRRDVRRRRKQNCIAAIDFPRPDFGASAGPLVQRRPFAELRIVLADFRRSRGAAIKQRAICGENVDLRLRSKGTGKVEEGFGEGLRTAGGIADQRAALLEECVKLEAGGIVEGEVIVAGDMRQRRLAGVELRHVDA